MRQVVTGILLLLLVLLGADATHWQNRAAQHSQISEKEKVTKELIKADWQETNQDAFYQTKITDWLILAAILLQAWIYWRQTSIMMDQLNITTIAANAARDTVASMRDQERRHLRAYVSIKPIERGGGITGIEPGSIPRISMEIQNHGLTPAHHARYRGSVGILLHDGGSITLNDSQTTNTFSGAVLFPTQIIRADSIFQKALTQEEYNMLVETDEVRITAVGIVDYQDVFRCKRTTRIFVSIPNHCIVELDGARRGGGLTVPEIHFAYNAEHTSNIAI